jgi:hypothetical protein
MPLAGLEPTIPVFKRAKTFHALDRAATVTGSWYTYKIILQATQLGMFGERQNVGLNGQLLQNK